jgi:DNA-directed RNA polymerase specialized sigma subunit
MTARVAADIHPSPSGTWDDADFSSRSQMTTGLPGDEASRRRLAEQLVPEIDALAVRYAETSPIGEQEFREAGARGLERALKHYVPEATTPFGPYAMWWIYQAMETLRSSRRG